MNPCLAILAFLSVLNVFAQRKWVVGNYAAVGIAKEWTVANQNPWPGNASPLFPEWEFPRTGPALGAGFSACRFINRSLFLETGLGLATKRYNSYAPVVTIDPATLKQTLVDTLTTRIRLDVVQVPCLVQWRIGRGRRWQATVTSGLVPGLVALYSNTHSGTSRPYPPFKRKWSNMSLAFHFGIGMAGRINERLTLLAAPVFELDFPANDRIFSLKLTLLHDLFTSNK